MKTTKNQRKNKIYEKWETEMRFLGHLQGENVVVVIVVYFE